jgi:hypothetical protein
VKLANTLLLLFLAVLVAEWQASGDSMSASEVLGVPRPNPVIVREGATLRAVASPAFAALGGRRIA